MWSTVLKVKLNMRAYHFWLFLSNCVQLPPTIGIYLSFGNQKPPKRGYALVIERTIINC